MNKAATQDVIGSEVWPVIRAVLRRGTAPDALTARAAELVDEWSRAGSSGSATRRVARSRTPAPPCSPARGLTSPTPCWSPCWARSWRIWRDVVGRPGGLVDKDLRRLLGRRVHGPFALRYCGAGNLERCASSLWAALKTGVDELAAEQGADPSAWRVDQGFTGFAPNLIPTTFPTTNRPTYQQVLELVGPDDDDD